MDGMDDGEEGAFNVEGLRPGRSRSRDRKACIHPASGLLVPVAIDGDDGLEGKRMEFDDGVDTGTTSCSAAERRANRKSDGNIFTSE